MLPYLKINQIVDNNPEKVVQQRLRSSKKIDTKKSNKNELNRLLNDSFVRKVKLQIGIDKSNQSFHQLNQSSILDSSFENKTKIYLSLKKRETQSKITQIQINPGPSQYFPKQLKSFDNMLPQHQFISNSPKFKQIESISPDPQSYKYLGFSEQKLLKLQNKNRLKQSYKKKINKTTTDDSEKNIIQYQQKLSQNTYLKEILQNKIYSQLRNVGNFTISKKEPKLASINSIRPSYIQSSFIPGPGAYEIYKDPITHKDSVYSSVFKSKVEKVSFFDVKNEYENLGPGKYINSSNLLKKNYNINISNIWN